MVNKDTDTSLVIRRASELDVTAIRLLIRASILGLASGDYSQKVLDNWGANTPVAIAKQTAAIRDGREITWVAISDGKLIGFSALDPQGAVVRAVYVHPEMARQGVATRLLSTLEAEAKGLELPQLTLRSSITAKSFYEQRGYQNMGEREATLSTGTSMISFLMAKSIRLGDSS